MVLLNSGSKGSCAVAILNLGAPSKYSQSRSLAQLIASASLFLLNLRHHAAYETVRVACLYPSFVATLLIGLR